MKVKIIMSKMEDMLMRIQAGEIPRENRELLEVLILSGLVKKENNNYQITEKGLEFIDKPVLEA
jgi:predicted transcriptional regulator